jgi:integrase
MSYAEKKQGKPTGKHIGEVVVKGRRFRRTFERDKDAKGYELYVKLTGEEPPTILDGHQPTGSPTFAEVAALCKAAGGPKGKWKAERDHSTLQRLEFCVGVIGPYEIQRVSRAVMRKITEALDATAEQARYKGPRSNGTKNRYLAVAHAVLTYAHQEEILADRPPAAPFLNEDETKKERDILDAEQEAEVLRLMREDGYEAEALCVEALSQTAMRSGELCEKIRPEQITIEQAMDEDGTPVHVGVIRLLKGQTKNNKEREVILDAELAKQIRVLIATERMPKGGKVLTIFKRMVKRAGVSGNVVVHSLRHARITLMRDTGVSEDIRMRLVGHENKGVHSKYGKVSLTTQLAVAKRIKKYAGDQRQNAASQPAQVIDFTKVS